MKKMKRIISLLFAVLFVLLAFPATVFAADETLTMRTSSVEYDLEKLGIAMKDYPKNADEQKVTLLFMQEYRYRS